MNEPASASESQNSRALRELRALILDGDFEAGSHMSEVALARQLGVSRTPLRQAMARLADETLLERTTTGRWLVASLSAEDVADAIELRGVMEGAAARLAAERGIDEESAATGHRILDDIDRLVVNGAVSDFDRYAALNAEFHSLLASLPNSRIVERELERIKRLPIASPNAFVGTGADPDFLASLAIAQAQHRALLDAIEKREGTRAESIAREHARLAIQNLAKVLESRSQGTTDLPGLSLIVDADSVP